MSAELDEIMQKLWEVEDKTARVALLEEAIRMADAANEIEQGFALRQDLVQAAMFSGFPEKVLVAFSWNLAQVDRAPEQFAEEDLLWEYKWVISCLYEFPQITVQQMNDALADLARRFKKNGATLRPIYTLRCKIARHTGDIDGVKETLPLWKEASRGYLSDCPACDRDSMVEMHAFLGQYRRALQSAEPILRGTMTCGEVPHLTYAQLLLPLLHLDKLDEALEYHRLGYALVKENANFLGEVATHLIFKVLINDLNGGIKVFERHLRLALERHSPLRRFQFFRSVVFLMRLLAKSPRHQRKLRLPESFPLHNANGTYNVAELGEWFDHEARSLAGQFDARNGNSYWTNHLDELAELETHVQASEVDEVL
jgi:hypothetical protein